MPVTPQPLAANLRQLNWAADLDPHWLAIYTSSRHEKHVAKLLILQQIESFLPLYRTVHRWRNRSSVELELPPFPNYLFVRIDRKNRGRVLQVPGVLALLGQKKEMLDYGEPFQRHQGGEDERIPEFNPPYAIV